MHSKWLLGVDFLLEVTEYVSSVCLCCPRNRHEHSTTSPLHRALHVQFDEQLDSLGVCMYLRSYYARTVVIHLEGCASLKSCTDLVVELRVRGRRRFETDHLQARIKVVRIVRHECPLYWGFLNAKFIKSKGEHNP